MCEHFSNKFRIKFLALAIVERRKLATTSQPCAHLWDLRSISALRLPSLKVKKKKENNDTIETSIVLSRHGIMNKD